MVGASHKMINKLFNKSRHASLSFDCFILTQKKKTKIYLFFLLPHLGHLTETLFCLTALSAPDPSFLTKLP